MAEVTIVIQEEDIKRTIFIPKALLVDISTEWEEPETLESGGRHRDPKLEKLILTLFPAISEAHGYSYSVIDVDNR